VADLKVSALTETTAVDGTEYVYVVEDTGGTPVSRRVTVDNLLKRLTDYGHAAATTDILKSKVTVDADYRLVINADGKIEWGDGTNPVDTNLYRSAASVLKTDDSFVIGRTASQALVVGGASEVFNVNTTAGFVEGVNGAVLRTYSDAYTTVTFQVNGATGEVTLQGSLLLGADVNLYRSAANILKTDDSVQVVGGIGVGGAPQGAGRVDATSFVQGGFGTAAVTGIGAMGPGGEAGILFGSAQDTNLYRYAGDILGTSDSFIALVDIYARGDSTQVKIGQAGPSNQSGISFQLGEISLYRDSANVLKTDDFLVAGLEVGARYGAATQVSLGTVGPAGQSGITFQNGEVGFYRSAADVIRTDDWLNINGAVIAGDGSGTLYFGTAAMTLIPADGSAINAGSTTGLKIGTATTEKLGFFNATPVVQPANTVDYVTMLTSLGLRASGGTAAATFPGKVVSTNPTDGVGYATGAGGTVAQATNKGTAVTLNKICGRITMMNSALAAAAEVSFVLNNSTIAADDVVVVCIKSGGTVAAYMITVTAVAAGSCNITVANLSTGSLSEALVLNFAVIKSVAA
jgi:hypothetical protein